LGQKLNKPATAAEAIKAAHLDWEVEKQPIFLSRGKEYRQVPDRFAVVRTDKTADDESPVVLGIVGKEYTPLQNAAAFDWFDPIADGAKAIYHTAGALGDGERVWILAKLPDTIRVIGDDITEKYLLLSNSHDGDSSVQVKFTPIRVVCQNTLTMALSQGKGIRVAHTPSLPERMKAARDALGIIRERFEEIAASFRLMAEVTVNHERLAHYVDRVFPLPADKSDEPAIARVQRARNESARLFDSGRGNTAAKVRGTLWAAYNGVAEFVDYAVTHRDANRRLDAIWFGSGYLSKARAYRLALTCAEAWKN
jgi:phage/plasmid-like protein (TIGR03299 family)